MSFSQLGLIPSLVESVAAEGYQTPSPIQAKAIPAVLAGKDVLAAAQTGTGKTAGFSLPILQKLNEGQAAKPKQVRALVLTPTRELAAQVGASIARYGAGLKLREAIVFGGVSINPQISKLARGVDVLVATPGRLIDLYNQNAVRFDSLEVLVLDEADRMLDMGFIHDIRRILKLLPAKRQNLMFSATFSKDIRELAKTIVNDPVEVSVAAENTTAERVKQRIITVDKKKKPDLLVHLLKENAWHQVLAFSRTKHGANRLATRLSSESIPAVAIHGNKSQNARTKALDDFKKGKVRVMVATDIAARGLDISKLPYVINVDLPNVPEDYVHRIGRTGRAGESGEAISLVAADEAKQLQDIERLIGQKLTREVEDGFEPGHDVPQTPAQIRTPKPSSQRRRNRGGRSNVAKDGQGKTTERSGRSSSRGDNASGKPGRNRSRSSTANNPNRKPGNANSNRKPSDNRSGQRSEPNGNR
ncbi:MAG: DEAD/DEAH box helicase [Gammaproteobacteria bacterium]|nr:DEAD/DEAH box helicase [Gammaproteobacteria bacterium]